MNSSEFLAVDYAPRGLLKSVSVQRVYFCINNISALMEVQKLTDRKLNHSISNLPDASQKYPTMSLQEVIHGNKIGKYGATEVFANQVW